MASESDMPTAMLRASTTTAARISARIGQPTMRRPLVLAGQGAGPRIRQAPIMLIGLLGCVKTKLYGSDASGCSNRGLSARGTRLRARTWGDAPPPG